MTALADNNTTHNGTFLLKSLCSNYESKRRKKDILQIMPTVMHQWDMTGDNEEDSSVTYVQIKDQFFSFLR